MMRETELTIGDSSWSDISTITITFMPEHDNHFAIGRNRAISKYLS